MKILYSWLKEFIPLEFSPEELSRHLLAIGFEVSGIRALGSSTGPAGSDHVLDLEILPNRPDCLSHFGIARELSVYFKMPLTNPSSPSLQPLSLPKQESIPVTIENPEHCPRYAAMTIENIKAVRSPEWLVRRLQSVGAKPRNIVVDVTNYVLYEMGHPLHAFDMDTLKGPQIRVRFARPGERFITLEGQDLRLAGDSLVIADRDRPVALAGIIGGSETGVCGKTSRVFLESAVFHPPTIRRTSRRFGIRTEASYRFERGADMESPAYAASRAAELILKLCAGARVSGSCDNYPVQSRAVQIEVSPQKVNSILGVNLSEEKIFSALKAVSKDVGPSSPPWKFTAPSHRRDLHNVWDIAEEVARLEGYDIIPDEAAPVKPSFSETGRTNAPLGVLADKIRKRISGLGFYEVYNYDFISAGDMSNSRIINLNSASLANPLSSDWEILRPSLLPGLLRTLRHNLARGPCKAGLYIFEIGTVYDRIGREIRERTHCAGLISGRYPSATFWKNEQLVPVDFFHLKGVVSRTLKNFSQIEMPKTKKTPDIFHPGICLEIIHDHSHLGWYGKVHPRVAVNWDIKNLDIWIFEFALDPLSQDKHRDFSPRLMPVSSFPSAWRDISITLGSQTPWESVLKTVLEDPAKELASAELIDLYEGKGIPKNTKSLTIRLTFCRMDRTLRDCQVESLVGRILERLSSSLGARLRTPGHSSEGGV